MQLWELGPTDTPNERGGGCWFSLSSLLAASLVTGIN